MDKDTETETQTTQKTDKQQKPPRERKNWITYRLINWITLREKNGSRERKNWITLRETNQPIKLDHQLMITTF